jgi:quercetin dioxygenase-like cupin family protein
MFYSLSSIAPQEVCEGYRARIFHGERITFAVLEVEPFAQLPSHSHVNEQVGLLVRGQLTFTVGEERRTVGAGDGWVIPTHALHDAVAGPEGAVVIETWAPPRDDFRRLAAGQPVTPAWPDRP